MLDLEEIAELAFNNINELMGEVFKDISLWDYILGFAIVGVSLFFCIVCILWSIRFLSKKWG